MEFLRTQFEQIWQHLSHLSLSAKMAAGLLAILVAISLAWIIHAAASPARVNVFNTPLAPEDLAVAEQVLRRQGIEVTVADGLLQVPAGEKDRAFAVLAYEQVLPPAGSQDLMDLVLTPSMFRTETEAKRLWAHVERGRMSKMISGFPGVKQAQVILDKGSPGGVGRRHIAPTASVNLVLKRGEQTDSKMRRAIADLVCGAVPDLKRSDVRIIDSTNKRSFSGGEEGVGDDMRLESIAQWQKHYTRNVERALGQIPNLHVSVYALPDPMVTTQIDDLKIHEPVSAKSASSSETITGAAGRPVEPGVGANTALSLAPPATTGGSSAKRSETESAVKMGQTRTVSQMGPGGAKDLSVSVGVPLSHLVHRFQNLPGNDDQSQPVEADLQAILTRYRDSVKASLAITNDDQVRIDWYLDDVAPVVAEVAQAGIIGTTFSKHSGSIALGTMAVAALGMVMMFARRRPPEPPSFEASLTPEGLLGPTVGAADDGEGALEGIELDDDSLRAQRVVQQVSQMVQDRPDGATNLIQRWIEQG